MATLSEVLRPLWIQMVVGDRRCPSWPPDAFALSAYLLDVSGGYLRLLRNWPPRKEDAGAACLDVMPRWWHRRLRGIGRDWRRLCVDNLYPQEVAQWWSIVADRMARSLPITDVRRDDELCCALLHIAIAADEASSGAGLVGGSRGANDQFFHHSLLRLAPRRQLVYGTAGPDPRVGSTLCTDEEIDRMLLRVLPKLHTPQAGMTLRSISHHLALWRASDVVPNWFSAPLPIGDKVETPHRLNLLLLPWPDEVHPTYFEPSKGTTRLADGNRLFTYHTHDPEASKRLIDRLDAAFEEARRYCEPIHGVILPELALDEKGLQVVSQRVLEEGSFLVAGVGQQAIGGRPGTNRVSFVSQIQKQTPINVYQKKHHRWRIDDSQILQYQLGGQLDPEEVWWEHIEIDDRALVFVSMERWITLCALVCEDLARQDPVSQLVRSVGPNLVITLLMDGPQLPARWPERYATVLAEDPGCSVLTLTSLGMCQASQPPGVERSRSIALWKDATRRSPVAIELPKGKRAVVLNLARHQRHESTADGRRLDGASYPRLAGIHYLDAD